MTVTQILLFGGIVALNQKISEHKLLQSPDAEDFDYAEDDDDDPSDFSVDQFLGDDSFIQTKSKRRNLKEDLEEHYFNTIEGEDDMDDDEEYDDAFVQLALKNHVKSDQRKQPPTFLQRKKSNGPDDEDYDFAEDDDDDPADFSVGQFLDDDDSFIQTSTRASDEDDDDDYADDRLGAGNFVLTSDAMEENAEAIDADDEEEEEDDTVHQVLLQEARKIHESRHKHKPQRPLKSLLGITDVYAQFAEYEKKHHNDKDEHDDKQGWEAVDDNDEDEEASFIQKKSSTRKDINDGDDEDDDLADDRLDGGMDQIIAATQ